MATSMRDYMERVAQKLSMPLEDIAKAAKYEYPRDLDLTPGSDLSNAIVQMINEDIHASRYVTDSMQDAWQKMEWTLSAYMPMDEHDAKQKSKDSRRPVTVVVPQTFALREMLQAYSAATFLRDESIINLRIAGTPTQKVMAALNERLLARQAAWFDHHLKFDMLFGQAYTYSRSFAAINWSKKKAMLSQISEFDEIEAQLYNQIHGANVKAGDLRRYYPDEETLIAEGSELVNLDPRQMIIDPHYAANDLQKSECIGWMYRTNAFDLLSRENDPEENLFNAKPVRALARQGGAYSCWWNRSDGRGTSGDTAYAADDQARMVRNAVDVAVVYKTIIPAELGLGSEETPQKWCFAVAGDYIVIQCYPLTNEHGMYPVVECCPNANGLDPLPISHLMAQYALQTFSDWLLKSRQDSARTILNGLIFFDPSVVDPQDMLNPGMGKLVRYRPNGYGESRIGDSVHQMHIEDVTAGHMLNVEQLDRIARTGIGANDVLMGDLSSAPERPTATGINSAQTAGFNRINLCNQRMYFQAVRPFGFMAAMNNRQYLEGQHAVDATGRNAELITRSYGIRRGEAVTVSAWNLIGPFEVEPYNPRMTPGNHQSAMAEVMKTVLADPNMVASILGEYRVADMFAAMMRMQGFTDIEEYRSPAGQQALSNMNIQTMSDEELDAQLQAGNMAPIGKFA